MWALFDAPEIERIAAAMINQTPLPYEWEGMVEGPTMEADGAKAYLDSRPGTPIAPYLHLFIAHRRLCAAEVQGDSPERKRNMAIFGQEIRMAVAAGEPLIRFVARNLQARPRCFDE